LKSDKKEIDVEVMQTGDIFLPQSQRSILNYYR